MPTYEYECTKCERVFEVFQPISAKAKRTLTTECDRCNNKAPVVRRIGTGGAVLFKGSGFYETDYRSKSYQADAKKESEATGGDKSTKTGGATDKESGSKSSTDAASKSKSGSTDSTTSGSAASDAKS